MNSRPKCILILSTKSAGSSALQELLCVHAGAKCVERTRHAQHETLFWTKAASVLGKPQHKIPNSEVPIPAKAASKDLLQLLRDNLPGYSPPSDPVEMIFQGWRALCVHYAPIFIEKSPHHLHQWSALELMLEAERRLSEVEFRYIGLVRNPMDALYSMWAKRRDDLASYQAHWGMAYENLLRLRAYASDRLIVVRYEDLVGGAHSMEHLFRFLGQEPKTAARSFFHSHSRQLWRHDRWFGLQLDPQMIQLARQFGYSAEDLHNDEAYRLWPAYQVLSRFDPRFWRARWRQIRRRINNVG
jgi:Sulfotransferase family